MGRIMTRYEKMFSDLQKIGLAMNRATSESVKNMWWLQYQRLKYRMNNMTMEEAVELV